MEFSTRYTPAVTGMVFLGFASVGHGRIFVPVHRHAFEHWDNGWVTEPGEFALRAGSSVSDLPLSCPVQVR